MSFIAARRRAGLDHIELKDLRHWAATHLVASGVDIKTIAGRLGHSPQVLLKTYAHRLPARDEQGAAILGDLLSTTQTSDEHHLT
jgi:integrase